jgi:hypothetical protein
VHSLYNVDGKNVRLQLWDNAGDPKFRSIITNYFNSFTSPCAIATTSLFLIKETHKTYSLFLFSSTLQRLLILQQ